MKAIATSVAIFTGVSKRRRRRGETREHDGPDQEQGERVGGEAGEGLAHDGANMPSRSLIWNSVLHGFRYHAP